MISGQSPAGGSEKRGDGEASDASPEGQSTAAAAPAARPSLMSRIRQFFGPKNGSTLREDIADALSADAMDAASFSVAEKAMLNNILRLREARVDDVMIPRADIEAIEQTTTLGELLDVFEKSGHSRMPVYHETLDDPRGMVHIRDVVAHLTRTARQRKRARRTAGDKPARNGGGKGRTSAAAIDLGNVDLDKTIGDLNLTRPVLFVPPSMLAADLLSRMQAARIQMALVIDEYGGTDGLVSLEDIVEMVVGDIEDEHDDDEALVSKAGEGVYVVDAKAEIEEVAEMIGDAFNAGEHADDVDTIGGMIFNTLGRVPARGEVVQAVPGFEFHVLEADPRRVKRVRIVQSRTADRRRRVSRQPGE
ncbi:MAG: hemolysin family protein [Rhizobiaceae bacterium]